MGNRWRLGAEYIKNPFDTPERVAFRKTLRNFVENEIKPHADHYNHHRYHESINYLTPADGYFGRDQAILK